MKFGLTLILVLAAVIVAPNAEAQLPRTHSLSADIAQAINHAKVKSVVVFDFWGPDNKLNALGQYMAQNFSLELSNPPESFSVLDRSKITDACTKHNLSSAALRDPATSVWLANGFGANPAVVLGQLSIVDDKLTIQVTSYKTQNGKLIASFKANVAITDDMRALMAKTVPDVPPEQSAKAHSAGKNGYGYPKCLHCPNAPYDQRAADNHLEGTVTLITIVGADGKAHEMFVIKALPDGLTERAVETVKIWKFQPATGPDGQPADVWQAIEVTFHLY
jgi:TonB family protein